MYIPSHFSKHYLKRLSNNRHFQKQTIFINYTPVPTTTMYEMYAFESNTKMDKTPHVIRIYVDETSIVHSR